MQDQELWVIDHFVNSFWFRNKFQLKIRWEDRTEEQDDWQDYHKLITEATAWRDELTITGEEQGDLLPGMINDYYA